MRDDRNGNSFIQTIPKQGYKVCCQWRMQEQGKSKGEQGPSPATLISCLSGHPTLTLSVYGNRSPELHGTDRA